MMIFSPTNFSLFLKTIKVSSYFTLKCVFVRSSLKAFKDKMKRFRCFLKNRRVTSAFMTKDVGILESRSLKWSVRKPEVES